MNRTAVDQLFNTPPEHFDLKKLNSDASSVVRELWLSRLELRKKFVAFHDAGEASPACVDAVRKAFVATRFLEEYVAEWSMSQTGVITQPAKAWDGEFPYVVRAPGFSDGYPVDQLRSGDILLSRGDAIVSAVIARVGDVEGQFSHLAMVYVDEETKTTYTIESHIEVGVVVAPIEKYLVDGKVRSTLFRFRGDPEIAKAAGKYMFDRARKATAAGANIPYDFHFDLKNENEVFCAEVGALGYRHASGGEIELPTYLSHMTPKYREFLNDIGMSARTTFAPMDMEVEPRFEMLAEWRDLSKTHEAQQKDQVLTAVYSWMQRYHYVLDKTAWTKVKSNLLLELRKWPLFNKILEEKFPANMSARTMEATLTVGDAAEKILGDLVPMDEEARQKTGLWLTPRQMLDALEKARIDDFSRWERWEAYQSSLVGHPELQENEPEKPHFHEIFRPADAN